MDMDVKELLAKLDIDISSEATEDQVLSAIHDNFVSRELAPTDKGIVDKVLGKHLNVLERNIKKHLKSVGIEELDNFDLKAFETDDPELNPIYQLRDVYESKIEKIKAEGGKGSSQKVKELEDELARKERDAMNYKAMLEERNNEYEQALSNMEAEKKSWVINQQKNEAFKQFKLSDTVDQYKMKGFDVMFNEKYKMDIEGDQVVVLDKDGNRVPNEKKSGHATLQDVLKMELDAANMLKKNNADDPPPRQEPYRREPRKSLEKNEHGRLNKASGATERLQQSKNRLSGLNA